MNEKPSLQDDLKTIEQEVASSLLVTDSVMSYIAINGQSESLFSKVKEFLLFIYGVAILAGFVLLVFYFGLNMLTSGFSEFEVVAEAFPLFSTTSQSSPLVHLTMNLYMLVRIMVTGTLKIAGVLLLMILIVGMIFLRQSENQHDTYQGANS